MKGYVIVVLLLPLIGLSQNNIEVFEKEDIYIGGFYKRITPIPYWTNLYFGARYVPLDVDVKNIVGVSFDYKRNGFLKGEIGVGFNKNSLGRASTMLIGIENYRLKNLYKEKLFLKFGIALNYEKYVMHGVNGYFSFNDAFRLRPIYGVAVRLMKKDVYLTLNSFSEFGYSFYRNRNYPVDFFKSGTYQLLLYRMNNINIGLMMRI